MSHFTRIQTQIREQAGLLNALRDLHYTYRVGDNLNVRGYYSQGEKAEVVVDTGCDYDIGFVRKQDAYEAVADWDFGIHRKTSIRQRTFVEQLNRQYAYNNIVQYVEERNLIIEDERTLENGDTVFILAERC